MEETHRGDNLESSFKYFTSTLPTGRSTEPSFSKYQWVINDRIHTYIRSDRKHNYLARMEFILCSKTSSFKKDKSFFFFLLNIIRVNNVSSDY